jgi:hypothetical protein
LGALIRLMVCAPAPAQAQAPADAAPSTVPSQSFNLNLVDAPGGVVVDMVDLVRMLETIYPGARSRWDAQRGMVRLEVANRRFDVLAGHKMLIVDGKILGVPRPLSVVQGRIYFPVETIQAILQSLNLDFELQAGVTTPAATATADEPAPGIAAVPPLIDGTEPGGDQTPKTAPPAVVAPRTPSPFDAATPAPLAEATSAFQPLDATLDTTPAAGANTPSINLSVLISERPLAAPQATPAPTSIGLQPPSGLSPRIGLGWRNLADAGHRIPPERITLVCDPALQSVADGVAERLNRHLFYRAQVIVAPSRRRDQEKLQREVADSATELLVDLMAIPNGDADPNTPLFVWVAHEALWPDDRAGEAAAGIEGQYRPHQFQSLALGSLLRGRLGGHFPDRLVIYEMSPALLLRRTAAPSAGVLIPTAQAGGQARLPLDAEQLADAVAEAVSDYAEGLRGAL